MALIHADFVEETTTTTGTGTLSLAGAVTGNRTFVSGIGDGNTCTYALRDANGTAWEVGVGTVTDAATDTLSRDTVIASSTGSKIDLSTGTHTVYCTWSAEGGAKAYSAAQLGTTQTWTATQTLKGVVETVYTITDGSSVDIDPANGTVQVWTLGAARTPTATNFAAGQSITLMIADGTAYTITWTSIGVTWAGGSAPTLATSGYTVITLWKVGSTIYGAHLGDVA
jgi:hypothetical protein